MFGFTEQQKMKLKLFDINEETINMKFKTTSERDFFFEKILKDSLIQTKSKILEKIKKQNHNIFRELESRIRILLTGLGFIEVATPTVIPYEYILKMNITEKDTLWKQIIWISDGKKCLRPMLAPNLYITMKKLKKLIGSVRIFEIGSCFRKERGKNHLTEFTMCNAVIYPASNSYKDRYSELLSLINNLIESLGLDSYEIVEEESIIYGKTIDILCDNIEIGSAVVGPVDIDSNWKVNEPWIGFGIGLERILMVKHKSKRILPFGRSLEYLEGFYLGGF